MIGRRRRARGAALALAAAASPLAAGAALGPRYGGDLAVGCLEVPARLESRSPRGMAEGMVAALVHERLVRFEKPGHLAGALARDWEVSPDGRECVLRLAPAATFHDGVAVGPEDASRSVRRFLRSASPAGERLAETLEGGPEFRAGRTDELPGLELQPDGLVLRFRERLAAPLAPLASPAAAVVSATGSGAGPFVPTAAVPGRRLALTAFGRHLRGRPFLDRVELRKLPDAAALEVELQARRVGLALGAGHTGPPAATLLLILDPGRRPFQRAAVRTALADALRQADIVRHVVPGAEPAALLLPPLLLPAGGAPRSSSGPGPRLGGPAIDMAVSTEVPPLASQRLVAYLGELGLRVAARPVGPDEVLDAPMAARLLLWMPEVAEPELALRELTAMGPVPAAVGEALEGASRSWEAERRESHLRAADRALRADGILVPLGAVPLPFSVRADVHGVALQCGRLSLENAWLEPPVR